MPVAVTTWLMLPSEEPIKAAWANAALVVLKGYDDRGWPSVDALRESLYRGLDHDAIIRRVGNDVRRVHASKVKKGGVPATSMLLDIAIVDDYYTRQLAALRDRQVYRVARGGTVWLVLVVLTYAAAFSSSLWQRRARLLRK